MQTDKRLHDLASDLTGIFQPQIQQGKISFIAPPTRAISVVRRYKADISIPATQPTALPHTRQWRKYGKEGRRTEHELQRERDQEDNEAVVVANAHAVVEPWAVMVEALDAPVADGAVARARGPQNETVGAHLTRMDLREHL